MSPQHSMLFFVCILYLTFRALVLLTNFDEVTLPVYELSPMGNLAYLLSEGHLKGQIGHSLATSYDNCGGHLVVGLIATPLFWLFGPSYLVLKLVPILLGLGTLILLWRMLDQHFGRRAALTCCVALTLGPLTLVQYSLLAKGNHFEGLFFQVLALHCFLRAWQKPRVLPWITAGISAGFAVFFYFGAALLLALMVFMVACSWRSAPEATGGQGASLRRFVQRSCSFLFGCCIGALPLLWIELSAGGRPTRFFSKRLLEPQSASDGLGLSEARERLVQLVTEHLPAAACSRDFFVLPGAWLNRLFLVVLAVSWLVGLRSWLRRRGSESHSKAQTFLALLLLYPLGWIVAYSMGRFHFDPYAPPVQSGTYRYLIPFFLFGVTLTGVATGLLQSEVSSKTTTSSLNSAKRFGSIALCTLLWICGLGSLPLASASFESWSQGWSYQGYDLRHYSKILLRDRVWDPESREMRWDAEQLSAELDQLPEELHGSVWYGIGFQQAMPLFQYQSEREAHLVLESLLAACPTKHHSEMTKGLGSLLRAAWSGGKLRRKQTERWLKQLCENEHPQLPALIEGLCIDYQFPLRAQTERRARLTGSILKQVASHSPHLAAEPNFGQ